MHILTIAFFFSLFFNDLKHFPFWGLGNDITILLALFFFLVSFTSPSSSYLISGHFLGLDTPHDAHSLNDHLDTLWRPGHGSHLHHIVLVQGLQASQGSIQGRQSLVKVSLSRICKEKTDIKIDLEESWAVICPEKADMKDHLNDVQLLCHTNLAWAYKDRVYKYLDPAKILKAVTPYSNITYNCLNVLHFLL